MAYDFTDSSQSINWDTTDSTLYQAGSASIGFWIKMLAGVGDDKNVGGRSDNFPVIICKSITTVSNGYGVRCEHIVGGGFAFGVDCVPGAVNPAYKLALNQWMFFGFSRDDTTVPRIYRSYFGSRSAMLVGPTGTYVPGQDPLPISTPGQVVGTFYAGCRGQANGIAIGPLSYWARVLTQGEFLSLAQCTLPADSTALILWTKMFQDAVDLSIHNWPPNFNGSPPPLYEADSGCASFAEQNYRVYNS